MNGINKENKSGLLVENDVVVVEIKYGIVIGCYNVEYIHEAKYEYRLLILEKIKSIMLKMETYKRKKAEEKNDN